jgi:hypothetical protein
MPHGFVGSSNAATSRARREWGATQDDEATPLSSDGADRRRDATLFHAFDIADVLGPAGRALIAEEGGTTDEVGIDLTKGAP